MTQESFQQEFYPLTNAIFDDLIDWLKNKPRFLSIIGKWCDNISAERVRDYVDDIFPIVFVGETENSPIAEFNCGEYLDPNTQKPTRRDRTSTKITLSQAYVFQFENYLQFYNNRYYGNNINIRLSQNEQENVDAQKLFKELCEIGFTIPFVLIHEFIHYIGWERNIYPYSRSYFERLFCFNTESDDDYRVELCQQELFNYAHPYYMHGIFNGQKQIIFISIQQALINSGIFYEWQISFTRFRFKAFTTIQKFLRQTVNIWDERIDFRNRR